MRSVVNRYAKHATDHAEDIAQDVLTAIQARFFSKGRSLNEGAVRTIVRQEALNYLRRKYHPTLTEDMKFLIQQELSRMIATGNRTNANGYTSEHLTEAEWETAKQFHQNGWSLTATSNDTGIPMGTLQRRLSTLHYKQATFNNREAPAYSTCLSFAAPSAVNNKGEESDAAHLNTKEALTNLMEEATTLTPEDREQLKRYLEGELGLSEIRGETIRLRQYVGANK